MKNWIQFPLLEEITSHQEHDNAGLPEGSYERKVSSNVFLSSW